jgi:hypothetical protein
MQQFAQCFYVIGNALAIIRSLKPHVHMQNSERLSYICTMYHSISLQDWLHIDARSGDMHESIVTVMSAYVMYILADDATRLLNLYGHAYTTADRMGDDHTFVSPLYVPDIVRIYCLPSYHMCSQDGCIKVLQIRSMLHMSGHVDETRVELQRSA